MDQRSAQLTEALAFLKDNLYFKIFLEELLDERNETMLAICRVNPVTEWQEYIRLAGSLHTLHGLLLLIESANLEPEPTA